MVFEKLKEILAEQLDVDADSITKDSMLIEDLGADSLDAIDIVMSVEDEFNIEVPDEIIENIEGINISCDTVDGVQYLGLSVDTPWYYNEKTRNMGQKKYEAILMKYISCVTDEKLEIKNWAAYDDCDW